MVTAIICAAGKGERAGFSENKILRELNGLPVLAYSISAFAQNGAIDEIVIVCRREDRAAVEALWRPYSHNGRIVEGGATRTESVYNGLKAAQGNLVLVHDAARPYLTQRMINDCIATVKDEGSAVCAVPVTDTLALSKDGRIVSTPDRTTAFSVQTPQGFYKDKLLEAFESAYSDGREGEFTDESGIYAAYVAPPRLCEGDRRNKKLTYPEDFLPAARVGFGVDTHSFISRNFPAENFGSSDSYPLPLAGDTGGGNENASLVQREVPRKGRRDCDKGTIPLGSLRSPFPLYTKGTESGETNNTPSQTGVPLIAFITLGGVRVPSDSILKAHSDGDVLVHALMDALLSAAGLRDIGYYFPDTNEKYSGADSVELLKEVMRLVNEAGFAPQNASISILAETPRLSPYIDRMKETLAPVLGLPPSAIGIAAGTNEKLGYIGEGKGITCYATVLLGSK